jgi:hypothetical protein
MLVNWEEDYSMNEEEYTSSEEIKTNYKKGWNKILLSIIDIGQIKMPFVTHWTREQMANQLA